MPQPRTTKINLRPKSECMYPKTLLDARMDLKPNQMDVLAILLAEIGKETDVDEQRHYTLTAQQFCELKGYKTLEIAHETMRVDVTGKKDKRNGLLDIQYMVGVDKNDFTKYNFFSSVRYFNGSLILAISPEVKEHLVELKRGDTYKIWAALQYLLPLKSTYTKQIYIMCRNFVTSGIRYAEDWDSFRERIGVPSSYFNNQVKALLEKAKQDINAVTDLNISYTLVEESCKGGKRVSSISFKIEKKKQLTTEQKKAIEHKKEGTYEKKENRKSKNKFNDFDQRDYTEKDYEELESKILQLQLSR